MSVTEIASKSVHRERILGTHFWNPPFLIPLVEVVRTADVSDHAVDAVCDVLREAGKKPIVVKKRRARLHCQPDAERPGA